jgi:hypothetical protein
VTDEPKAMAGGDRSQRSAKNLIIDRRFQVKHTLYLVGLTLAIGAPLCALLYQQATAAVRAGDEAVQVGSEANDAARDSVEQAKLLNTRLDMEAMMKAAGDQARIDAAKAANKVETDRIAARAAALASQQSTIQAQRDTLAKQRTAMLVTVGAGLAALLLLVGMLGITFTHRVAGPIYRMRLLFKEVAEGRFAPYRPLRKGDELQDFFAEFSQMVEKLRARQRQELERLDKAIKRAEASGADTDSIADLRVARDAMRTAIAKSIPPPPNPASET